MTVCAIEMTTTAAFTIAADGSYAARLAGAGESLYAERWTLAGPEAYAVPLPLAQPEEADSEVLPLADGRVLIHRRVAERHAFALLYPTGAASGPRTGELQLGGVEAQDGVRVRLLPPSPDGSCAFALAAEDTVTTVWQVAGAPSARRPSPGSRDAARVASGWTGRAGCWPWTASWTAPPRPSPSTWRWARSPRCCRSPRTATTCCCWPTRTAGCC